MHRKPKFPELKNAAALEQLGETFRQLANDVVHEELPENIAHLLKRLGERKAPKE